jgi:transposase
VRFRAEALYAELDVLGALRPQAKTAMLTEARRDPAWPVLRGIPFLGPVRVALLLATLQTPWRFRTKRNLWASAGLAVVTHSSADHELPFHFATLSAVGIPAAFWNHPPT